MPCKIFNILTEYSVKMCYPTDFFIRIFYEKPFNQGFFQKKMRIKFFRVYNEVSKI